MIDDHAIKLATEYLDGKFAKGEPADLIGMLNHVDYYERVVMVREEIQAVLNQRPSVTIQRADGRVIFTQTLGDREITEDDLKHNVQLYLDDFDARYQRLQGGD
jgi:hypothetical protein